MPDQRERMHYAAANMADQFAGEGNSAERSTYLPSLDCWPNLSAQEREYRSIKLLELQRRIDADGPRKAQPHPNRARQFMPFAALKGYHELAHSKENWEE